MTADPLPDDPGTLKAMLIAERAQNDRLRQIIKELQRQTLQQLKVFIWKLVLIVVCTLLDNIIH